MSGLCETMRRYNTSSRGFTLIELLVVISIIVIAASIIIVSGSGGLGTKLRTSERLVSATAQGARGQAILKGAITRLIIYSENGIGNTDDEKKLRYFGIVYADPNDPNPTAPTNWIAATQGTYLPEGIYFDPDGVPSASGVNTWPGLTMTIDYPRRSSQAEGSGQEYYYYEYNSNGTTATGYDNAWLVLRAGALIWDGANYTVAFPDDDPVLSDRAGLTSALIVRRVGTTSVVNDPSQIN